MNICLHGSVPKSAGLSSSSALVVCAALATVYANKLELSKTDLAETCATAEQYVGTIGGGMDQAISCLAESGAALLIDFNPLKAQRLTLPENCRLATQILAKSQGLEWRKIKKPLELQKLLGLNLLELIEAAKSNMHQNTYTLDEVCQLLEATKEEIILNSLSQNTSECNNHINFFIYKPYLATSICVECK